MWYFSYLFLHPLCNKQIEFLQNSNWLFSFFQALFVTLFLLVFTLSFRSLSLIRELNYQYIYSGSSYLALGIYIPSRPLNKPNPLCLFSLSLLNKNELKICVKFGCVFSWFFEAGYVCKFNQIGNSLQSKNLIFHSNIYATKSILIVKKTKKPTVRYIWIYADFELNSAIHQS